MSGIDQVTAKPGQTATSSHLRIPQTHTEQLGLIAATAVLFGVLAITAPYFLETENLLNVLEQASFTGIIAVAMTFVIIAGEIDISVGSAMAFASALFGLLAQKHGWPVVPTMVVVVGVGGLIGLLIGMIRAVLGIPSFIVTLAFYSILAGAANWLTNAIPVAISSNAFAKLGNGDVVGIPTPVVIMLVVLIAAWFLLNKTSYGRSVFAVGGNGEAARLAGINVRRIRASVFVLTGVTAALAGLLVSAQLSSSDSTIGQGDEFTAISAVVIGGASLFGGRGSMLGTLLGILLIGLLDNGMVLLNMSSYAQGVASGVIVLIAVVMGMRNGDMARLGRVIAERAHRKESSSLLESPEREPVDEVAT